MFAFGPPPIGVKTTYSTGIASPSAAGTVHVPIRIREADGDCSHAFGISNLSSRSSTVCVPPASFCTKYVAAPATAPTLGPVCGAGAPVTLIGTAYSDVRAVM